MLQRNISSGCTPQNPRAIAKSGPQALGSVSQAAGR
jgi:hypothetical protein